MRSIVSQICRLNASTNIGHAILTVSVFSRTWFYSSLLLCSIWRNFLQCHYFRGKCWSSFSPILLVFTQLYFNAFNFHAHMPSLFLRNSLKNKKVCGGMATAIYSALWVWALYRIISLSLGCSNDRTFFTHFGESKHGFCGVGKKIP